MSKHTPTPWVIDKPEQSNGWNNVQSVEGFSVATCWGGDADHNAEFIVRACNSHDGLLEALKQVMGWIDNWSPNFSDHPDWLTVTKPQVLAEIANAEGK